MGLDKAYTFDDLLILPKYSDIEREDVDIRSYFHWYCLSVPVMSSPMDTITEIEMMMKIYEAGGLGFHHRYVNRINKLEGASVTPGGLAVSPSMGIETILKIYGNLTEATREFHLVVLDVAHGHTKKNLEFCAELVKNGFVVISGNIVHPQAVEDYLKVGVKDFRVGIGSGSVCTTRTVAGVGMPQASAIKNLRRCFPNEITIISDGGHKTTADIVKALALGADFVMLGGMLAGCNEVPELGKQVYRGMASRDARNGIGKLDSIPEGITKSITPKDTSVADVLEEIRDAIKLACYYVGAKNLQELREKSEIIVVTDNGYKEGLAK